MFSFFNVVFTDARLFFERVRQSEEIPKHAHTHDLHINIQVSTNTLPQLCGKFLAIPRHKHAISHLLTFRLLTENYDILERRRTKLVGVYETQDKRQAGNIELAVLCLGLEPRKYWPVGMLNVRLRRPRGREG